MIIAMDVAVLIAIVLLCWRGYRGHGTWLPFVGQLLSRLLYGRGFWGQLLCFAPLSVGWLMLCHRVNTAGWHATAAGGILIAMTVGLELLRKAEEQQKLEKSLCEK